MKQFYLTLLFAFTSLYSFSQRSDTVRRYFDENMVLTTKNKVHFPGVTVKQNDHWYLFAVYPDTGMLIKSYFKDEDLRVKDGPFTLYHRKNLKAAEGRFQNNTPVGVWKYWYENGQIKDSGLLVNNNMADVWRSWYEDGNLLSIAEYPAPEFFTSSSTTSATQKGGSILDYGLPINKKQGQWRSFYPNGTTRDSGLFQKNQKQGLWKNWYDNAQLESMGNYSNDSLVGEWQYFRRDGSLSTKEIYAGSKIKSLECFDENGNATGDLCSILKPAVAKGSFYNLKQYALDNIYWPKELDGKQVEGVVKVRYTISAEGKMIEFKVLETPHEALSKEVQRFFASLEGWYPAISHNRAIDYTTEFSIEFYR